MASHSKVAMSLTPIVEGTVAEGSGTFRTIEADIGKSLGGSYSIDCAFTANEGSYAEDAAGTVTYISCTTGAYVELGTHNTAYDIIYIKHTGFVYSSPTVLGDATTDTVDIYVETVHNTTYVKLCSLPAGGAIALPSTPALGENLCFQVKASGSDHLAMEYVAIT